MLVPPRPVAPRVQWDEHAAMLTDALVVESTESGLAAIVSAPATIRYDHESDVMGVNEVGDVNPSDNEALKVTAPVARNVKTPGTPMPVLLNPLVSKRQL